MRLKLKQETENQIQDPIPNAVYELKTGYCTQLQSIRSKPVRVSLRLRLSILFQEISHKLKDVEFPCIKKKEKRNEKHMS